MSLGTVIRRRTRFSSWLWRWVFDERRSICSSGPRFTGEKTLSELNQLDIFIRRARIQSRNIPADAEVMNVFQKCYVTGKGVFVIKSKRPLFPNKPQQYYRCDPIFDRLNDWLRKKGVSGSKPLHTLRKEYGSLLTRSYGIRAASRALRHADLRTTSEHYSDSTARVTPGIGRLLTS
jgi:integrase